MGDLGLARGIVVYGGSDHRAMSGGIDLVPWQAVREGDWHLPL